MAISLASFSTISDDVPDSPHQPGSDFVFPKWSLEENSGKLFISAFLHYKESNDTIFCRLCLNRKKTNFEDTCRASIYKLN